jgi:hypothetical protein
MTDVADASLGPFDPGRRLWPFSLGGLPGLQVVALHVDGATADPASWSAADRSIHWTGGELQAPQDAYVTVKLVATEPRGKLTAGRVALLTAAMAMFGGLGGAWINRSASTCPSQLAAASAQAQGLTNKVEACQGAVGILNVVCGGVALGGMGAEPATRTAQGLAPPSDTALAMRAGR